MKITRSQLRMIIETVINETDHNSPDFYAPEMTFEIDIAMSHKGRGVYPRSNIAAGLESPFKIRLDNLNQNSDYGSNYRKRPFLFIYSDKEFDLVVEGEDAPLEVQKDGTGDHYFTPSNPANRSRLLDALSQNKVIVMPREGVANYLVTGEADVKDETLEPDISIPVSDIPSSYEVQN